MPFGYYECNDCNWKSEKEIWEGDGVNMCKSPGHTVKFINLDKKETRYLSITPACPRTLAQALKDAPTDCDEYQRKFERFACKIFCVPAFTRLDHLFEYIDTKSILDTLVLPEFEKALDYAIEKGWVKKKENIVIDFKEDDEIIMYIDNNIVVKTFKNKNRERKFRRMEILR